MKNLLKIRNLRSGKILSAQHHKSVANLVDFTGISVSFLCFIHCWSLPLFFVFLPQLAALGERTHMYVNALAILFTMPLFFKNDVLSRSITYKIALISGNILFLGIVVMHDNLLHLHEIILSSAGGLLLMMVHLDNLFYRRKSKS